MFSMLNKSQETLRKDTINNGFFILYSQNQPLASEY